MKKLFVALSIAIAGLVLSGCGASSNGIGAHIETKTGHTAPVYIKIEHKNGTWVPKTIGQKAIAIDNKKEILGILIMRNGKLALSGFSSRDGRGFQCRKGQAEKLVYCREDTPFFSNTVGVRFKPYGGIKFSASSVLSYLESNGLVEVVKNYTDIVDYNNNTHEALMQKFSGYTKELDGEYRKANDAYLNKKAKIKIVVNDKTGVYDNSINFDEFVSYRPNYIERPKIEIEKLEIPTMDVRTSISKSQWHKKIDQYYAQKEKEVRHNIEKYKADALKKLKKQTSYGMLQAYNGYDDNVEYKLPQEQKLYLNKTNKVVVTISKVNLQLKYPIIKVSDKYLSVTPDGKFTNKTSKFLSIKSITYYLNKEIETDTQFDKQSLLEIAPESWIEVSANVQSDKFNKQLYFPNATAKKLKRIKLSYGIAVKYSMGDSTKTKTLYKTRTKSAYDLYKMQVNR